MEPSGLLGMTVAVHERRLSRATPFTLIQCLNFARFCAEGSAILLSLPLHSPWAIERWIPQSADTR